MIKRAILITIALTIVWIILTENFSWQNVGIGIVLGIVALYFSSKFLPNSKERSKDIEKVKFHKLITYPFWLIGKVYKDGISLAKLVITGAKYGIVKEQLELDNEVLRTMLADSVTLTPGTICLDLKDKEITVLCMGDEKTPGFPDAIESLHAIERKLKQAEGKKPSQND